MQNEFASFVPSKRGIRELKLRTRWLKDRVKLPPRGLTLRQALTHGFAYQVAVDIAKEINLDIKSFAVLVDIKPATLSRRRKMVFLHHRKAIGFTILLRFSMLLWRCLRESRIRPSIG